MSKLLFLAHRIPFPADKGDKIRSYHLLRHFAKNHSVYLGAFVDDPRDWQYRKALEEFCTRVELVRLNPRLRRIRSLSAILTGDPLSLPFYHNSVLQAWVDRTLDAEDIPAALAFSSPMASYLDGPRHARVRRIADFCDVDSDKWQQYAARSGVPMRWIYAREARKLLAYERRIAAEVDTVLFVSRAEADLFRTLAPEVSDRVDFFDNGVDTGFFDPAKPAESPYGHVIPPIAVFTGAMDYWANVDAATWFAQCVWPLILEEAPEASFWIVGSKPSRQVRALARGRGVRVTGRVDDVRPYIAHADVSVAPLRIARGVQNKVLEALAMARPVVCTPAACAGLRVPLSHAFRVASEPVSFAQAVLDLFGHGPNLQGRISVMANYSWEENLSLVDRLLAGPHPAVDGPPVAETKSVSRDPRA